MCLLVGQLSNCYHYFLRVSEFPGLFAKVFLISLKFPQLDFKRVFLQNLCKRNGLQYGPIRTVIELV